MLNILSGIAITSLMVALSIYLPFIGFFFSLFIPIPILYYRSMLGRSNGLTVLISTVFVLFVIMGGISVDKLYFFELMILGFILGEFLELNFSINKTVVYTCLVVFFTSIFGLTIFSAFTHADINTLISEHVAKNIELTIEFYKEVGIQEEAIYILSNSIEQIQYVMVRIIPGVAIVLTLLVIWMNLLIARPILAAKEIANPAFKTLKLWKAPEYLIWVLIGSGFLFLIPDTFIKVIGLNILMILITIYFFQGIAIVSFFFQKKRFPMLLKIFLYLLIALQQILVFVVVGLGLVDIWLNFRKIGLKNT